MMSQSLLDVLDHFTSFHVSMKFIFCLSTSCFFLPRVFHYFWLFTFNDFFKYAWILACFPENYFFLIKRIEDEFIRVMIMIWNLHTIYCWVLFVFIVIFLKTGEKNETKTLSSSWTCVMNIIDGDDYWMLEW